MAKGRNGGAAGGAGGKGKVGPVSLFISCLCDVFYPEVGESVVRVLRHLDVAVDFPQNQTCCGQPAFNSGYTSEALAVARCQIEAFAHSECVVVPSGSCAAMIRHYYPRLFQGQGAWEERARAFAAKVYEFSEFLVRVLGVRDIGAWFPAVAVYHPSCHMSRGLGVREEPLELLRHVRGLTLLDAPGAGDCCGFGGTFSVKMPEISVAMADRKLSRLEAGGARVLVGSDMGCLMHLSGRLRHLGRQVETLHVAEVLARGLDGREQFAARGTAGEEEESARGTDAGAEGGGAR